MDNKIIIHGSVLCIVISICLYTTNTLAFVFLGGYVFILILLSKKRGFKRLYLAVMLGIASISIMFGSIHRTEYQNEKQNIETFLGNKEKIPCCMYGEISRIEKKDDLTVFILNNVRIRGETFSLNRVRVSTKKETLYAGDLPAYYSLYLSSWVKVYGSAKEFEEASNDGGFDAKSYYESKGIRLSVFADKINVLRQSRHPMLGILYRIRSHIGDFFSKNLSAQNASILHGMILGEKELIDGGVSDLYKQTGIMHLLAISGLHISFIGVFMLKLLGLMRIDIKRASLISIILIALYVVMTGSSPSAIRAASMFSIDRAGVILGRNSTPLVSVLITMAVQLIAAPYMITNTGFLYSYVGILGIRFIGIPLSFLVSKKLAPLNENIEFLSPTPEFVYKLNSYPTFEKIYDYTKKSLLKRKHLSVFLIEKISSVFIISASVQLALLPLTMHYSYELNPAGLIANIIVLPLSGPLMFFALFSGLTGCIPVFAVFAKFLLFPAGGILFIYEKLCTVLGRLSFSSIITGKCDTYPMIAAYTVMGLIIFLCICKQRVPSQSTHKNVKTFPKTFILLSCVFVFTAFFRFGSGFEVAMLDVGQGDGIFIQTDRSHTLFVDGGSSSEEKIGRYAILPFLKAHGISHIDYWFVSHTDSDHISGIFEVIESGYRIDHLMFGESFKNNPDCVNLSRKADENRTKILFLKAGDKISYKDTKIDILYPDSSTPSSDVNEDCLTFILKSGDFTAFFGGDIGAETERKIVESNRLFPVTLFKANHHGSKNSNSDLILEKLRPTLCLISAGRDNLYHHPNDEAISRIEKVSSNIYCTKECRQITLYKKRGVLRLRTKTGRM